jgi:hypothetical protein
VIGIGPIASGHLISVVSVFAVLGALLFHFATIRATRDRSGSNRDIASRNNANAAGDHPFRIGALEASA